MLVVDANSPFVIYVKLPSPLSYGYHDKKGRSVKTIGSNQLNVDRLSLFFFHLCFIALST